MVLSGDRLLRKYLMRGFLRSSGADNKVSYVPDDVRVVAESGHTGFTLVSPPQSISIDVSTLPSAPAISLVDACERD